MKELTNKKKLWKNIRPYFSDKGDCSTKITIIE